MKTYLDLFTGIGGGALAMQRILGLKCVGYVENNEYCQKVIAQRISDGFLDRAPIFRDIQSFADQYAGRYRGLVDGITAGSPCQPFSAAGKKRDENDERNLWPILLETVGKVKPLWCFYENSPRLLTIPYFGEILRKITEGGFNARWCNLSAARLGAPYLRNRLWIYAYARGDGKLQPEGIEQNERGWASDGTTHDADLNRGRCNQGNDGTGREEGTNPQRSVAGATGMETYPSIDGLYENESGLHSSDVCGERFNEAEIQRSTWWDTEPELVRLVSGGSNRVERIESLGNCQIPIVAATAFRLLSEEFQ